MAGPLRSELIPRAASPCLGPSPKWGGGRRQGRSGPRLQRPPGTKPGGIGARVCSAGLEPRGGERPRRLAEEVAGCGALSLTDPRGLHNL